MESQWKYPAKKWSQIDIIEQRETAFVSRVDHTRNCRTYLFCFSCQNQTIQSQWFSQKKFISHIVSRSWEVRVGGISTTMFCWGLASSFGHLSISLQAMERQVLSLFSPGTNPFTEFLPYGQVTPKNPF